MRSLAAAFGFFSLIFLSACGAPTAPQADAPAPEAAQPAVIELRADGYGPVRIGMTPQEAMTALGRQFEPVDLEGDGACVTYNLDDSDSPAIVMMALQGKIARVSVYRDGTGVRTPEGIEIGSTDEQVRAAYGANVREQGPAYDEPPAHELIVWQSEGKAGFRFEVGANGVVHTIHGGGDAIRYIEGCL